jgi:hypothetical protein
MSSYHKKYLKYKNKYINLLGGDIRAENCKNISIFCNKLFELHNNIDAINKLYIDNILLFKSKIKFNTNLLVNLNYLLGIKIENITNEEIKKILQDTYISLNYNEIPIKLNLIDDKLDPECLKNIGVWYKPFILEDFWRCEISEFMDEFDRFEVSKQSYALYWTNLINISSLLCRIKTCNYYFININDDEKINIELLKSNINELYSSGNILDIRNRNLSNIKPQYPNAKYIFTYLNEITNEKIIELTSLLINSLTCEYNKISIFYLELMCSIIELENHNESFVEGYGDLLSPIKNICKKILESKDTYFYLSLNLPKDSTFARNEYTNIICSSINPINLIDNVPLSITQIIGHDYYFHKAQIRKSKYSIENKKDFRDLVNYLNFLNENKIDLFNRLIRKLKISSDIFNINNGVMGHNDIHLKLQNLKNEYLDKYTEDYDYLEMLGIIHYLFHETKSHDPFSKENFLNRINDSINRDISIVDDTTEYVKYNLEIIMLSTIHIEYYKYFKFSILNFDKYLNNRIQIIFGKLYFKNNNLNSNELLFYKAYLNKFNEINSYIRDINSYIRNQKNFFLS